MKYLLYPLTLFISAFFVNFSWACIGAGAGITIAIMFILFGKPLPIALYGIIAILLGLYGGAVLGGFTAWRIQVLATRRAKIKT